MPNPVETYFYIASQLDQAWVVDLDANGNLVLQQQQQSLLTQWWAFTDAGYIRNAANGLAITVQGPNGTGLAVAAQDPTAPGTQIWTVGSDNTIQSAQATPLLIDDTQSLLNAGNIIQAHVADSGTNQQWQLIAAGEGFEYNHIQSAMATTNPLVLSVASSAVSATGVTAVLSCSADRMWSFTPAGCVRCLETGFVLTAQQVRQSVIAQAQQLPNPSTAQLWKLDETTGYLTSGLSTTSQTYVLDVADANVNPGGTIICQPQNPSVTPNQQWSVQPACVQ